MASYVVMERRPLTGTRSETVFVRDDFSVLALLFPLIWLLWHRLWFAAVLLLLVSGVLGVTGEYLAPGMAIGLAGLAVSLFVALEGPAWRMAVYRRRGYGDAGTVIADNLDDAELRWFADHGAPSPAAPLTAVAMKPHAGPPPLPQRGDMLFGFAGEAGR
ncbi:MAG: DUF2628 domain-containing protein [Oricola sp.]